MANRKKKVTDQQLAAELRRDVESQGLEWESFLSQCRTDPDAKGLPRVEAALRLDAQRLRRRPRLSSSFEMSASFMMSQEYRAAVRVAHDTPNLSARIAGRDERYQRFRRAALWLAERSQCTGLLKKEIDALYRPGRPPR